MKHYIDKDALSAKIKKRYDEYINSILKHYDAYKEEKAQELGKILTILDTLEVKEVEEDSLGKFKSLQHISGDLKSTLQDWGYAPNLYYFDGSWHVDWISCEEGDSIYGFTAETPEEAIDKAYNWFHSTFCNS